MLNTKLCFIVGVFLVIFTTPTRSADLVNTKCLDCAGDSMLTLVEKYSEKLECWMDTNHHVIVKLQVYNLMELAENFKSVVDKNNEVVADECQKEVALESCDSKDWDKDCYCAMDNLRTVVEAYRDQEKCNGQLIESPMLKIASRLVLGSFVGWGFIHPDC
ncbi:uncharacterized protein LOC105262251 [Musca domestica]|uniref:Uncharacterized protein LOC105262251 n=1 Tax=Musca domestica TaxID=7370 RepID=A0A9J7IBM7_MUSDO|nr:uncharacterized protein LOC105262251 [Musca domestica]